MKPPLFEQSPTQANYSKDMDNAKTSWAFVKTAPSEYGQKGLANAPQLAPGHGLRAN
jgi:hypothetical protein